jgi:type VI secretion system protein ImpA
MAIIDVDKFLGPVSENAPCGEDLEYDAVFGELERAAQGKPEQRMGEQVIPGEDPNWREVSRLGEELLERSRDLRIVLHLTHAGVRLDGLPALAAGLRLVHGLLENYWDTVYPSLDEEDDNDPTIRLNTLLALNDRAGFLHSLSIVPLAESRATGRFGLRDIRVANGVLSPKPDEQAPDPALIGAAFMDCDIDELTAAAEASRAALAEVDAIVAFLRDRVSAGLAPDLSPFRDEIAEIAATMTKYLAERGVGTAAPEGQDRATGGGEGVAGGGLGQIQSRDDAIRLIDRVSEYFRKNEPSSPVPLLLQRAKRLVAKDFMEILQDLAPDGLAQAQVIKGEQEQE